MKLSEIEDKIALAKSYKYICLIELDKQKRKKVGDVEVKHDFSDLYSHYVDKIKHYESIISELEKHKEMNLKLNWRFGIIGVNAVIIAFFLLKYFK